MNQQLWAGALLAPVAWAIGFEVSYALVPFACQSHGTWVLHLTWLVSFAFAALGALCAHRAWSAAGGGWPGEGRAPDSRNRFLGLFGLIFSGAMMLLIVAQWFPTLVLDPCTNG
jgi:hypothetical protein